VLRTIEDDTVTRQPGQLAVLPPAYDHPYAGTLIVTRADKDLMRQRSPKTALAVTPGCAFPSAKEC